MEFQQYETVSDHERKFLTKNPVRRACVSHFNGVIHRVVRRLAVDTALFAGCGEGFLMASLENLGLERVWGVDIDAGAVLRASQKLPGAGFAVGDLNQPPYLAGSADLVICLQVLEHIEDPKSVLREVLRLSRRYVLVSVPHEPFFRLGNLLFLRNLKRLGNAEGHVNHWGFLGFRQLLSGHHRLVWLRSPLPWLLGLIDVSGEDSR